MSMLTFVLFCEIDKQSTRRTFACKLDAHIHIGQNLISDFSRLECQGKLFLAHDTDYQLSLHTSGDRTQVSACEWRVAQPHFRKWTAIPGTFRILGQYFFGLLSLFRRRHVFAHEKQVAQDQNLSPFVDDFLSGAGGCKRNLAIRSSFLLSRECQCWRCHLQAALLAERLHNVVKRQVACCDISNRVTALETYLGLHRKEVNGPARVQTYFQISERSLTRPFNWRQCSQRAMYVGWYGNLDVNGMQRDFFGWIRLLMGMQRRAARIVIVRDRQVRQPGKVSACVVISSSIFWRQGQWIPRTPFGYSWPVLAMPFRPLVLDFAD